MCEAATGNGPVDAVYQCINRITGYEIRIDKYELKGRAKGKNALGQVDIVAEYKAQVPRHGAGHRHHRILGPGPGPRDQQHLARGPGGRADGRNHTIKSETV